MVGPDQLNGGELVPFTEADWQLIKPYLEENERLFGIAVDKDLLTVDGHLRPPEEVYRKIQPVKKAILSKMEEPGNNRFDQCSLLKRKGLRDREIRRAFLIDLL